MWGQPAVTPASPTPQTSSPCSIPSREPASPVDVLANEAHHIFTNGQWRKVTRSREVTLTISVNASFSCATMVYVSEAARGFYLSWEAMMDLGIVSPNFPSVGAVADPAVTQQPPTRSTERHGSLNACGLAQTTYSINSCSCPPRTVVPVRPVALPFEYVPANNAKMEEWMLHRFASSTINTCPHRPLPCMTGPPVEIRLEDGVVPIAMHTAAPVPIHWQEQVPSDLKRD